MIDFSKETIFSYKDLKSFLGTKKKLLLLVFLSTFISVFALLLLQPVYFEGISLFQEGGKKESSQNFMKELLWESFGNKTEKLSCQEVIKSYQVLRPLIQKNGLQANVVQFPLILRVIHRIKDNLSAEFKSNIPDKDPFLFRNVSLSNDNAPSYYIKFSDSQSFVVYDQKKQKLQKGRVGYPIELKEVRFTIEKAPKSLKLGKLYFLHFDTFYNVFKSIKSKIETTQLKGTDIIEIKYRAKSRQETVRNLNGLMNGYVQYLVDENNEYAAKQFDFLESRQNEIYKKLKKSISKYNRFLEKEIKKNGFMSFVQESTALLEPYKENLANLRKNQLEELYLNQNEPDLYSFSMPKTSLGTQLQQLEAKKNKLIQTRDFLEISILSNRKNRKAYSNPLQTPFETCFEYSQLDQIHLQDITSKFQKCENYCQDIYNKLFQRDQRRSPTEQLEEIRSDLQKIQELKRSLVKREFLKVPNKGLQRAFAKSFPSIRLNQLSSEDLQRLFVKQEHLLKVKKKVLEERIFFPYEVPQEFQGIDLNAAKDFQQKYNVEIDQKKTLIAQLTSVKKQIENPEFDLNATNSILVDSISQKILDKVADITIQMKDSRNRNSREQNRLLSELNLYRSYLKNHVDEMKYLNQISLELIEEKYAALEQVVLDLVNRNISILDEEIKNRFTSRKEKLLQEKELLYGQMQEMRNQMESMPSRWAQERILKLETEIGLKKIHAMTQLLESKTIGHFLTQIQSKILDPAFPPKQPKHPLLILISCCMGLFITFSFIVYWLVKAIQQGLPVSAEVLQSMNQKFLGKISSFCGEESAETISEEDLETVRQTILFIEQSEVKVVSLINPNCKNYSHLMATLLGKKEKRVLLVDASFQAHFTKEDTPGFLQFLNKEMKTLPIRKKSLYDFVPSGGTTKYGAELLGSPVFSQFLNKYKDHYDYLLFHTKTKMTLAESKIFLNFSDKVVVSFQKESLQTLQPFMQWDYDKKKGKLAFITEGI